MDDETGPTPPGGCGCLLGPAAFVVLTAATLTAYVLVLAAANVVKVLPW